MSSVLCLNGSFARVGNASSKMRREEGCEQSFGVTHTITLESYRVNSLISPLACTCLLWQIRGQSALLFAVNSVSNVFPCCIALFPGEICHTFEGTQTS